MKKRNIAFVLVLSVVMLVSCKMIGRAAAKHWTKKQIKEFVTKCESNASPLVGADKAKQYCDCAVDVVAEEYQNYEDAKDVSIRKVLQLAKDCK